MQIISDLGEKISLILSRGRRLLVNGNARATQQSLAHYLEIDGRAVSDMIHGRLDKGVAPGNVSNERLDKLADLLAAIIGKYCTRQDARRLWEGDLVEFQIALDSGPRADLFETLDRAADKLTISTHRRKKPRQRAIRAAEIIPEDALELAVNQRLQFHIEAAPGRRLIALCLEPLDQWRLIAPGPLHTGTVEATPTVLPSGKLSWMPIDEPRGVHHFVFIEYDAALDPLLPASLPNSRILAAGQVADLAGKLANPAVARRWRWAEKVINARST